MRLRTLPLRSSKPQGIPWSLPCFLVAGFFLCSYLFADAAAAEMLDEISKSKYADQDVKSALEVLKTQIDATRRKLSSALTNEFEQSIAAGLKTVQDSVSHNILPEYKSAMMAKRILELSEHVLTLPYRKMPEDAQQRSSAQQQYAAVLDRFEKDAPDKVRHLDEPSGNVISRALRQPLTDVQKDIFRTGYGRPLSDQEQVQLNRIVDGILQAASVLPEAAQTKGAPSGFPAAGKVANDGIQAVLAFLRSREPGLVKDPSFIAAFKSWRKEVAALERAIDRKLESTSQAEISAVVDRANQQARSDLKDNDPKNVPVIAVAPAPPPVPRFPAIARLCLLALIVIVPLFFIVWWRKSD